MKVCKMGLESIWINHANGEVRICGWNDYVVGSLLEHSIEDLWHGEMAKIFRDSMLDGSYIYCDKNECPYCANNNLESMMVEYNVPKYPKYLSLSYEESCNYACIFCRKEKYVPRLNENENFKIIEREVGKFVDQLETLSANGVGEVFCSPSSMNILANCKNPDVNIQLESNGSLFNRKNWERISNLGEHNLSVFITVHSFKQETYSYLSGTELPVSNVIENLHFIRNLREQNLVNKFELATVICEKNFREMPDFISFALEKIIPDSIRLRFFVPYGIQDRATEWFLDVRNPYHPEYKEFVEVMKHPVFDNPKIWRWQGNSVSKQKEHPYYAEHEKSIILSNLLEVENGGEKFRVFLKEYNIKSFALYGNSMEGRAFAAFLNKNGIVPTLFLDTYAKGGCMVYGCEVVKPSHTNLVVDAIIITTMQWHHIIEKFIKSFDYKGQIFSLSEVVNRNICGNGLETGIR